MILGKSLNIFSIKMGIMASMTLQGYCEYHTGSWRWKNLNCKVHPVIIDIIDGYSITALDALLAAPYLQYHVQTVLAPACCSSLFTSPTLLETKGDHSVLGVHFIIFIPGPLLMVSPVCIEWSSTICASADLDNTSLGGFFYNNFIEVHCIPSNLPIFSV